MNSIAVRYWITLSSLFIFIPEEINSQPLFSHRLYFHPFDAVDHRISVMDYNQDGDLDVVLFHNYSYISYRKRLLVFLNDGNDWIGEVRELAVFHSPEEIEEGRKAGLPLPEEKPRTTFIQQAEDVQKAVNTQPVSWGNLNDGQFQLERKTNFYFTAALMLDWDGDGIDDLFGTTGKDVGEDFMILKGKPEGGFEINQPASPTIHLNNEGLWPKMRKSAAGDINEDGITDTITLKSTGTHFTSGPVTLTFSLSQPNGQPPLVFTQDAGRSEGSMDYILLHDFDRDRHLDLFRSVFMGHHLSFGLGDGTFGGGGISGWFGGETGNYHIADFNGDGLTDILATSFSPDILYPPGMLYIALGRGRDGFEPTQVYKVMDSNQYLISIRIGDANGDGLSDLVVGEDPGELWINRLKKTSHAGIGEWMK